MSPNQLGLQMNGTDQTPGHRLMLKVLCTAGGEDVETLIPPKQGEKRADVLFRSLSIIAEIKELTTDRSKDPKVAEAINHLITIEGPKQGGPIFFGTNSVRLDQLPDRIARNSMRVLTKRIQYEVGEANKQIKQTKPALGMPEAKGLLVFIAPPMPINLGVIGWAVNDAMRGGVNSSINALILVEASRKSYISFHSRDGWEVPMPLKIRIGEAWGAVTGQLVQESDEDFFTRYP